MVGSRAEAVSAAMQAALRARLGRAGPGADAALLEAHLRAAYDRLAFTAHGDRRALAPSAIISREEFARPVDAEALVRAAAQLHSGRLDDVEHTPVPEPYEHAAAAAAPRAAAATRELPLRSMSLESRLDVYLGW